MSAPLMGLWLHLFGCEHIKVPVQFAYDNFSVAAYAGSECKQGKRRVNQIVQVDRLAADVQESVAAAVGHNIAADNVSAVVDATGNEGKRSDWVGV
jgi:hypothetical protein